MFRLFAGVMLCALTVNARRLARNSEVSTLRRANAGKLSDEWCQVDITFSYDGDKCRPGQWCKINPWYEPNTCESCGHGKWTKYEGTKNIKGTEKNSGEEICQTEEIVFEDLLSKAKSLACENGWIEFPKQKGSSLYYSRVTYPICHCHDPFPPGYGRMSGGDLMYVKPGKEYLKNLKELLEKFQIGSHRGRFGSGPHEPATLPNFGDMVYFRPCMPKYDVSRNAVYLSKEIRKGHS